MKREYVERVRTRAFLVLTLLLPGIMTVLMALPAKLATMGQKAPHLVIVASTQQFGETVRQQLLSPSIGDDDDETATARSNAKQKPEDRYVIDIDASPTEAERAVLLRESKHTVRSTAIFGSATVRSQPARSPGTAAEMMTFRERSWLSETCQPHRPAAEALERRHDGDRRGSNTPAG